MILEETAPGLEFIGWDAGGGEIFHLNGEPFTGMITFRDSDGNIEAEVSFVSGFECGFVREYYSNGNVHREYYKKLNRLYGINTEWDQEGNSTFTDYGPEP